MVGYALYGAIEGSDPFETLCCISHTRTCSWPPRCLAIELPLLHLDLHTCDSHQNYYY